MCWTFCQRLSVGFSNPAVYFDLSNQIVCSSLMNRGTSWPAAGFEAGVGVENVIFVTNCKSWFRFSIVCRLLFSSFVIVAVAHGR